MTGIVLQLPTALSFATIDVARLTDSHTYARGAEYLHQGRVLVTREAPDSISATVIGNQPYEAHLSIRRRALDFRCSCPVGTDGAFCKHLVALALTATGRSSPGDAEELSAAELRSWLATLEHAELVELLAGAADDDEELREQLARLLTAGTDAPPPIAQASSSEAIAVRSAAGRRDVTAPCCWAHEAHEVIDEVETLLSGGHATDVRKFCEFAVNYLETNAPDIFDADNELVGLAARLDELQRRACLAAPPLAPVVDRSRVEPIVSALDRANRGG